MKCIRRTEEEKEAIRAAYLALPRSKDVTSKKRPGQRIAAGALKKFLEETGISVHTLWKLVYDLQPWRKSVAKPSLTR